MKVILRPRTKNDFFSSFLSEIGLQVLPLWDIFFSCQVIFFSFFNETTKRKASHFLM
jgi:hypothetical protein